MLHWNPTINWTLTMAWANVTRWAYFRRAAALCKGYDASLPKPGPRGPYKKKV